MEAKITGWRLQENNRGRLLLFTCAPLPPTFSCLKQKHNLWQWAKMTGKQWEGAQVLSDFLRPQHLCWTAPPRFLGTSGKHHFSLSKPKKPGLWTMQLAIVLTDGECSLGLPFLSPTAFEERVPSNSAYMATSQDTQKRKTKRGTRKHCQLHIM